MNELLELGRLISNLIGSPTVDNLMYRQNLSNQLVDKELIYPSGGITDKGIDRLIELLDKFQRNENLNEIKRLLRKVE